MLTTGADNLAGTSGNETFTARVVQNVNGEQTNQLATGDVIKGGAGVDTLAAKVIAASALNNGPVTAIAAETTGVEKLAFTALTTATATANAPAPAEVVEINAKFMNGVTTISSVHSDATLLVTNVNTLKDDGVYANKRLTEALTVRMDHSGNGEAASVPSDMVVLLDNDYLLRGDGTSSAALTVRLSPQIEEKDYKADAPLTNNPYNELSFKIDGVTKKINIGTGTDNTPVVTTYVALKAAIEAGLKAAGLADVTVTQNVGAYEYYSRDGVARKADTFTLSKDGAILTSQVTGTWVASAGLPDSNSFGADVLKGDAATTTPQVTINVELEKVGRGSDGGQLIVGGMATDGENNWDYSKTALVEGIEKFNITVSGDASQFSSLSGLHSTNNTLQTVVVTSAKGSEADLIIGNSNTGSYVYNNTTQQDEWVPDITSALKDVRDFNSTAFANDLTLNASVTDEAVAKYMNLKDTGVPTADNANFAYDFGAGNDTLNLEISAANLAAHGTTTREDFSMAIDTGAGDDKVTVAIVDGVKDSNWMANSDLLRNLSITTGEGADTVHMKGAGTWNVATDAGNDTVYSDNTGAKAVWVFNTANQTDPVKERELDNLLSDDNDSITLYKGTVAVSFKGLKTAAVEIASTKYKSSDLQINQAIKAAINNDAVLNKLLVAVDGPANTLIVKSLIDGKMDVADLELTFGQGTLTAAETTAATAAGYTAYAAATADNEIKGLLNSDADGDLGSDYVAAFAYDSKLTPAGETEGAESEAKTINVITGGAGKDVIVLSTGDANSVPSTDTVVLNSTAAADADVIVNFTPGSDKIQLSKAVYTSLGDIGPLTAAEFGTEVVYNNTTGVLSYDADGTGSGAAVVIATLVGLPAPLTVADFAIIA